MVVPTATHVTPFADGYIGRMYPAWRTGFMPDSLHGDWQFHRLEATQSTRHPSEWASTCPSGSDK